MIAKNARKKSELIQKICLIRISIGMKNVFFVMSANCRSSTSRLDPKMIHSIVANAIIKLLPLDAINALKYSNQE